MSIKLFKIFLLFLFSSCFVGSVVHAESISYVCKFFPTNADHKGPPTDITLLLERGILKDKIVWNGKDLDDAKFNSKSNVWTATAQEKNVNMIFLVENKIFSLKNHISGANLNFKCK
jgi:hypothetical protein